MQLQFLKENNSYSERRNISEKLVIDNMSSGGGEAFQETAQNA